MKLRAICELDYEVPAPTTFLLNVRAQSNACQAVLREDFTLTPPIPVVHHTDGSTGNRFDQITAEVPGLYHIRYEAEVETTLLHLAESDLPSTRLRDLSLESLHFLYPSRYSQSDRLGRLAMEEFGHLDTPLKKVRAIVRWITDHILYSSGTSNASTSAVDTIVERQGVCRDFAHLGIALCRGLNIPARYFTGYAVDLEPPDFHACFETWIGGHWLLWDATGLAAPEAMVHIGTGRDAADVAVCTSFGNLRLQRQKVVCLLMDGASLNGRSSAEKAPLISYRPGPNP